MLYSFCLFILTGVCAVIALRAVCALGCATLVATLEMWAALVRGMHWCARWLYPEYTIPAALGLVPLVLLAWALLR